LTELVHGEGQSSQLPYFLIHGSHIWVQPFVGIMNFEFQTFVGLADLLPV